MSRLIEDNLIDSIGPNGKGTILRSMAIFTAMELCGSFLTGKTGPGTTERNFKAFCESEYLLQYNKISPLLYSIFRNGVAHSYVPKGSAQLTSDPNAAPCHLIFYDSGICIFVPQLADDVKAAILLLVKDIKKYPDLEQNYKSVFSQLEKIGTKEYQKFIKENDIEVQKAVFKGDIDIRL